MLTISAPGKLMLFGEHAVVYGYPCIATAIDERLFVSIEETGDGKVAVDAPQVSDTRFVDEAINVAIAQWQIKHNGFRLTTKSAFSGKYGFGSSSAVTVATLKALVALYRKKVDNRMIFDAAYEVVLSVQGAASGFDVAAATYGGTIYYQRGGSILEPIPAVDIPLIIGYTGVKADTKTLVAEVAKKRDAEPEKVERIFEAMVNIVDEAREQIMEGDWVRVGRLMDFNQEYLRNLGVSSEKLESLISAAKKAGAYGAKLSGAGGGDCMIALADPSKRQAVEDAIIDAGGEVVHVPPNAPGVRIETTDNQDEVFIVVDREDNVLGYKTRGECHRDKTLIHRTVGALIFNDKGELLLQKRSMTKDMEPGKWSISSAGHVLKGQTTEEAVHRELQEELGIDTPLTFINKFLNEEDMETELAFLYQGVHNGPFVLHPDEVDEVDFIDPRAIKFLVVSRKIELTQGATKTLKEVGIL